jgi:hypothetical protein
MMRTKFLLLSAIIFLFLGWKTEDSVLFLFFAVHLFTLTIGVLCSRFDKKLHPTPANETLPGTQSSKS